MLKRLKTRLFVLTSGLPRTFWLLWVGTLVNRLGGFVVPFLALYLTSQRGIPVGQAAMMVSLFGAGSFVAALIGGELADRLGRRPVLLISFLAAPVNMLALGLARELAWIAPLTLVQGFLTDLYRPAINAIVADVVPSESRPRAYGYIYWAINLGFAFAPAIAGLMARWSYYLLFLGDALTTFLFGLIVLWGVRETRPAAARLAAQSGMRVRLNRLGREPLLLLFSALILGFGSIYMQGNVTLPIDMQAHGLGPSSYGLAISINGVLIVLTSIPASHWLARHSRFGALAAASVLLGAGFGLNAVAGSLPMFAASVAIWTLGEIAGSAIAPAIVADLSPVDLRGLYQGVFGAAWGLSFFIGPSLGGWIYERYGPQTLWPACFVLGCLLALAFLTMAKPAGRHLAARAAALDG